MDIGDAVAAERVAMARVDHLDQPNRHGPRRRRSCLAGRFENSGDDSRAKRRDERDHGNRSDGKHNANIRLVC